MATTLVGLVSGIWRARAGTRATAGAAAAAAAFPVHEFCCCLCIRSASASRGLHAFFPASNRHQQPRVAGGPGMQCLGLVSNLSYGNTYISKVSSHPHLKLLPSAGSGRQFHTVWNRSRRDSRFSRGGAVRATAIGDGDDDDLDRAIKALEAMEAMPPHTRGMASSKTKEQPRGSLWRTRSVISKETVQAVYELKRNKDNPVELAKVFQTRISRLLKMDLLATLSEVQRQNEIELALQVFDLVRKEIWYKPDQFLYRAMMDALGRNRRIPELEKKFQELKDEGIKPEVPIYRELVGAYVRAHMLPEALEVHAKMVELGYGDDPLSLKFIEIAREKEAVRTKQRRKAAEKLNAEQEEAEIIPSDVQS